MIERTQLLGAENKEFHRTFYLAVNVSSDQVGSMANEMIDVYDESLTLVGSMQRDAAHNSGALHKTIHCWFVDSGHLYFQIRGENVGFPLLLDATVGGHLTSGESDIEALKREGIEEVGIEIDTSRTTPIGRNRVEFRVNSSLIREFSEVYMLAATNGLDSFTPNPAELFGIAAIPFSAGRQLLESGEDELRVETIQISSGLRKRVAMAVRKESFIPYTVSYFQRVLEIGERYAMGDRNLSI